MSSSTTESLKRTPLFDEHVALNARMVPFGGWEMPVQYPDGILAEYEATRRAVTVFDTCHMGEFVITGDLVASGLDKLVTMKLKDMPLKTCRYGLLLNENGGTIDDLIVFRVAEKEWFIVVNGSTTQKDAQHMQKHLTSQAQFKDISMQTGKLDIQGPQARDVLSKWVPEISKLAFYTFDHFNLWGERVLISRTGYTGELGYEVYLPWDMTPKLWQALLNEAGAKPAGLGARDVLRLEMGYSLYGHELEENISPLEAGLNRFIDWEKDFIGLNALKRQKEDSTTRKLIAFSSESRRAPRAEQTIYSDAGEKIGSVTSGTFSPFLNKGIGLGLVRGPGLKVGEKLFFGDDKNKNLAMITSRTFFTQGSLKN